MFSKILIANRGEIACRVIRTARQMGIATVAVYSDADARAPHVKLADEAVRLGPPPASESYLNAELIIDACKATGAEAVHPGYGFLSERESFARALEEAGIAFIGPPAGAIAAMGDKIESKKLAQAAGVSVVPGFLGEIGDTEHAVKIAGEIGFPVMMKASAGGGGKGMRLAFCEKDVREGFEATKREGLASFGDDRIFIEKFVENPRHIEIQLIGDKQGNLVHLGERECSVQRRHQKVIEEAPSPFVTPEMRRAMGEQAVALARAVGYFSAGTVEFIAGADRGFYFLEMNTRLQVEHPVTEEVTGLDLVELMIRVAAGEALPFGQDEVKLDGWAIESRVYAEDPYRGFLPSTGRLVRYRPPRESPEVDARQSEPVRSERSRGPDSSEAENQEASASLGSAPRLRSGRTEGVTRVDDGVDEGGEVSMFYDPMIAKLISWAPTREAAIDRQIEALDSFLIEGIGHNVDFLSAVMQHPRFRAGALTTGFIAEEYPEGFAGAPADARLTEDLAVIAAFVAIETDARADTIDGQLRSHSLAPPERIVRIGGTSRHMRFDGFEGGLIAYVDEGEGRELIGAWQPGQNLLKVRIDDRERIVQIARRGREWRLTTRGASHIFSVLLPHVAELSRHMIEKVPPDFSKLLLCPMPGLLTALHVAAGERVEAGQPLAVVEAMKMENILRAGKAGTVKSVQATPGDSLAVDAVILEFE
ncbi:MAG TPA: acetyl/propionyl/methylcrotonyl-CoA carboxylase subunit alpha [Allosphingosinicella sp.]|nr:acetyl/propionyl/methylcrotonyl-CoA carboxylase subunit alpha [Allosphingosinicella sp.]